MQAETIQTTTTINELADKDKEIGRLNGQLNDLTARLSLSEEELEKYQSLISSLNGLLKNVYYGYAKNDKYQSDGFTAFSIYYKDKYYLITAGHCVHYKYNGVDNGVYTYFKFKANFSDEWIYPKLLTYDNNFSGNKDYAIFISNKLISGFDIGSHAGYSFILGSMDKKLNIIKNNPEEGIPGESGSPIINLDGKVISIFTGGITYIETVTEAIDNLK